MTDQTDTDALVSWRREADELSLAIDLEHCRGAGLSAHQTARRVLAFLGLDLELSAAQAAQIAALTERVRVLEAHTSEQASWAEWRIQDGIKMGATVWRIALEDIARENRTALSEKPAS